MMSRQRIYSNVVKAAGATLAVGSVVLAATELPGLLRYFKLKRMAKRDGASVSPLDDPDNASYVQAPRRFDDGHDGAPAKRRR
jgi:hypothetical protein